MNTELDAALRSLHHGVFARHDSRGIMRVHDHGPAIACHTAGCQWAERATGYLPPL